MKIKTDNLPGPALDWAVAKCEGFTDEVERSGWAWHPSWYNPSTSWAQGGPIIEREEIGIRRNAPCSDGRQWEASGSITAKGAGYRWGYGPTPLIAAMRCYVASRLGEEVEIPDELIV
jgi:hypothetical protein